MTENTYQTRETEYDDDSDERINFKAIDFNQSLIDGIEAFEKRDFSKAFEKYNQALSNVSEDEVERRALLNSNIAMIHFYNHDYKKALSQLETTLEELKTFKNSHMVLTDYQQAIYIKLLGNVCALNLFLNRFDEARDCSNEITSAISTVKPDKKKLLHEGLCFTFFRFKNFEILKDGYFQNLEDKYSGETLGCLYLILGLTRELMNDPQLAIIYYKKSFEVWQRLDDKLFQLLACRHITALAQELNIAAENAEYSNLIRQLMSKDEMKNISLDLLFKDFEKRLALAKEITSTLRKQEEAISNAPISNRESVRRQDTARYDELNSLGEPFWKQALKLKLNSALKSVTSLRNDKKTHPSEKKQLELATIQIRKSLQMVYEETNPLIQEQLLSLKYTKEAIDTVKASMNRIKKVIANQLFMGAWKALVTNMGNKQRQSIINKQKSAPNSIYVLSSKAILAGDNLTKINFKNGAKSTRFFKVFLDNSLRWSQKEKELTNPKVYRSCHLSEVKGIVYGKVSDRIVKEGKKLDAWLCMSLVLPERTIDLFLTPEQINLWYIGLSEEIRKVNKDAFCMTVGKFLWRKLVLMGTYQINQYLGLSKKKREFNSFVKALVAFKRAASSSKNA